MTFKKITFSTAVLVFMAVTAAVFPATAGATSPEYMTANALMHAVRQNRPLVIVDVRSRAAYETLHIPGSVHIPLYAVKTRSFLKSGRCVLVNNGFVRVRLAEEYETLKAAGFDVVILNGGINAWLEKGLPVNGDLPAGADIRLAEPVDVFMEKPYGSFLPVNASSLQEDEHPFPGAVSMDLKDENFLNTLRQHNRVHPVASVLVFNDTGAGYETMRERLLAAGINNIFFLKGGLQAYQRYMHDLELSRAPLEERVRENIRCRSCGD